MDPDELVEINAEYGDMNIPEDDNVHHEDDDIPKAHDGEPLERGLEGLEFSTFGEALDYYRDYAHSTGFGVRKRYGSGERPRSMKFVCSKEGMRKPTAEAVKRKRIRAETRANCEACIIFKLNKMKTSYIIMSWNKDHNHELHPMKNAHMIKSNRRVNEVQGVVARMNDDAGITLRSTYEVMCLAAGGSENLGFQRVDLRNHLSRKRGKGMKRGEATSMYEYFQEKYSANASFFFAVEVDIEEKVANIFWVDAKMRANYACFGDCITFDTTFGTNNNYRPLGVFVGFNHHRQISIFGVALLYDESATSFEWLFTAFLRCMSYRTPQTIFTDQCSAMGVALSTVMSGTFHALCTWHLLENAKKGLSPEVISEVGMLMYVVSSEEEFNVAWGNMVAKYYPDGNLGDWLVRSLQIKEKWVASWVRQNFTAGMCSTQLSESVNAVCKKYLKPDHDIVQFFTQFEGMVASRRRLEEEQDFRAPEILPNNYFPYSPIMISAAEHYTPTMLGKFHEEFQQALQYIVAVLPDTVNGELQTYNCYALDAKTRSPVDMRVVRVRVENIMLSCSCRLFESVGILCRHILTVMDLLFRQGGNIQMGSLPPHYIMKRWTKKAKLGMDFHVGDRQQGQYIQSQRYQNLCAMVIPMTRMACVDDEMYRIAETKLGELSKYLEKLGISSAGHGGSRVKTTYYAAPNSTERRGTTFKQRPKPNRSRKRLRSIADIARVKARTKIVTQINRRNSLMEELNEDDITLTL